MKNAICLFLFFFVQQLAFGQMPEPMKNIATPNAASLGTYGDLSSNLYTGQPGISIPLYEVVAEDLKVPIQLNYNLASVKPNQHSSWVGLGWGLSPGGQITRSVRGIMDEKQYKNGIAMGFYKHCSKIKGVKDEKSLRTHQKYLFAESEGECYELAADEFVFNFNGYSGRFYLNGDGAWTVVSDSDIKVIFTEKEGFISTSELRKEIMTDRWYQSAYCNRYFNQFTLVTPDGVKYMFGGKYATEYSIPYYSQNSEDLVPTTWYLNKIQNLKGESIVFTYEAFTPICELKYAPWGIYSDKILCPERVDMGVGYGALSGHLLFPVYLKKIETNFVTVTFHTVVDTYDGKPYEQFLTMPQSNGGGYSPFYGVFVPRFDIFFKGVYADNVNQYRKNILNSMSWRRLYAINIHYNREDPTGNKTYYFQCTSSLQGRRNLLAYITERKGDYKAYYDEVSGGGMIYIVYKIPDYPSDYTPKSYRFHYYNDKVMPSLGRATEDHWGYWNGYPFLFSENVENIVQQKGSNFLTTRAETLKEIVYPTGGKANFEYEMNDYSKVVSPSFVSLDNKLENGGGLRISCITMYDFDNEIDKIKKYHYTKEYSIKGNRQSESSGVLKRKPTYESIIYTTAQTSDPGWLIWPFRNNPVNGKAWLKLLQSGGFMAQPTNDDTPSIGYSSVFEEKIDAVGNSLGYTHYRFSNYDTDVWGEAHLDEKHLFATATGESYADQFSSKSNERGKVMAEDYYDANDKILKSIRYKYQKVFGTSDEYLTTIHQQTVFFCTHMAFSSYASFSSAFKTYTYSYLPSECIETTYDSNGKQIEIKTQYTYNKNKLLIEKVSFHNDQSVYKEKYKYSVDLANAGVQPYVDMDKINYKNALVENVKIKNGYAVEANYMKYGCVYPDLYKPITLYTLNIAPPVKEGDAHNQVDGDGNPTNSHYEIEKELVYEYGYLAYVKDRNNLYTRYEWGYDERYPIIVLKNMTLKTMDEGAGWALIDYDDVMSNMEMFKRCYPRVDISLYDYIPLIGLKAFSDSRGNIEYYEYDELGCLLRMKDVDGKVIKEFKYSYRKI